MFSGIQQEYSVSRAVPRHCDKTSLNHSDMNGPVGFRKLCFSITSDRKMDYTKGGCGNERTRLFEFGHIRSAFVPEISHFSLNIIHKYTDSDDNSLSDLSLEFPRMSFYSFDGS